MTDQQSARGARRPGKLLSLLVPYWLWIGLLIVLTIAGNALNLVGPQFIAHAIDSFGRPGFSLPTLILQFVALAAGIFVFTYVQAIVQTLASERVARDLRQRLVGRISQQDFAYIQTVSPARLLTNLTSDVDAIKNFVSQAIASIVSSLFLIVGASVLLLLIDWQLALAVLAVVPIIGDTFYRGADARAEAVPQVAGRHRLAQQGDQRVHPRRRR